MSVRKAANPALFESVQEKNLLRQYDLRLIYVGDHLPPHFEDVLDQIDRFFSVIHENWNVMEHPTMLPAYALWRMNWIPLCRRQRPNSSRCLLLPDLPAAGANFDWQQAGA